MPDSGAAAHILVVQVRRGLRLRIGVAGPVPGNDDEPALARFWARLLETDPLAQRLWELAHLLVAGDA